MFFVIKDPNFQNVIYSDDKLAFFIHLEQLFLKFIDKIRIS